MEIEDEVFRKFLHDISNKISIISGCNTKLEYLVKKGESSSLDEKVECIKMSKDKVVELASLLIEMKNRFQKL